VSTQFPPDTDKRIQGGVELANKTISDNFKKRKSKQLKRPRNVPKGPKSTRNKLKLLPSMQQKITSHQLSQHGVTDFFEYLDKINLN
jgi:hypothetical protein